MGWFFEHFLAPFVQYGFMRRALAGSWALAVAAGPLGVFLVLRRLSLVGDAMAHAILPGVAVGFLIAGLSVGTMTVGGVITGLVVAVLAGLVSRMTPLREDASFSAFYLISLGLGVLLVSLRGTNMDLIHVLFGTVLGLNDSALVLMTSVASLALVVLAAIYRVLVADSLDPAFLRSVRGGGTWTHMAFLLLLVLTLVAGFQVLGTLMVVGIMMLPATAARFWVTSGGRQMQLAATIGAVSCYIGLLLSYHTNVPASPAIILVAGSVYLVSVVFGPLGGVWQAMRQAKAVRQHVHRIKEYRHEG